MITELLLSGLASASVAFNTNSYKNKQAENLISVNDSLLRIDGFEEQDYFEHKNIDSVLSSVEVNSPYVDKETNTWKNTYIDVEDNNEEKEAQRVGPYFEDKNSFVNYDNFEVNIVGSLYKIKKDKYDQDFFQFTIYGKARIDLSIFNYPCNYDVELTFYDNADYSFKKYQSSYNGNSDYKSKHILLDCMPGNYWIRVFTPDSNVSEENEDTYQIELKASYLTGKREESFSDLLFDKGVHTVAWVSDFRPLNLKAFENIESKSQVFYSYRERYLLEMSLLEYGKILQSSLFLTGFKNEFREKLLASIQLIYDNPDLNSNEAKEVEVDNIVIAGGEIILGIILFNPQGRILTTVSLVIDGLSLGLQASDLIQMATCIESAIPTHQKLTKEKFKDFLHELMNEIRIATFEAVIRINYYYALRKEHGGFSDTRKIYLVADYQYEIKTFSDYSTIDKISSYQEGSYFRGDLYQIKVKDDMEKAKNHVHVYYQRTNTSDNMTIEDETPYYLHEGEYHWYSFTAPKTAYYHFYSKRNKNDNLDPFGELSERIYGGQIYLDDSLACDDNSLGNKNFEFFFSLLEGQNVFIRIRGAGWKTHGYYSLHAEMFSESPLEVEHISKNDLGFPCSYSSSPSTKEINLTNDTKTYIKSYRCGTVKDAENNYYLTLSCIKEKVNEAYIWFSFDKPIVRFMFDIALWGYTEIIADGKADLTIGVSNSNESQSRFSAELYTSYSINDLPKNRDKMETKGLSFMPQEHIYGLMINIRTNYVTSSTRNLGRVVLDNFYFGF